MQSLGTNYLLKLIRLDLVTYTGRKLGLKTGQLKDKVMLARKDGKCRPALTIFHLVGGSNPKLQQ